MCTCVLVCSLCGDGHSLRDACVQGGSREIKFRARCGDALDRQSFYVLLYSDQYNALLHQVWRICIFPMLRHDVHAVMGQGVACWWPRFSRLCASRLCAT